MFLVGRFQSAPLSPAFDLIPCFRKISAAFGRAAAIHLRLRQVRKRQKGHLPKSRPFWISKLSQQEMLA
ncbi:MAG: hypothetical protein DMG06_08370 [Acidobacteria bacterium]|nr:MAG: hypothetical protein DMG06_08370 [Acidobacteriota bacterium]